MVSLRIQELQTEKAEKQLRLNLELLEEKRDDTSIRMTAYQQRMMEYHNVQVHQRGFQNGDLILQKVSIATQVLRDKKLGPNWEGPYRITGIAKKDTYFLESMEGKPLPRL